jgi:hypothetical protein
MTDQVAENTATTMLFSEHRLPSVIHQLTGSPHGGMTTGAEEEMPGPDVCLALVGHF